MADKQKLLAEYKALVRARRAALKEYLSLVALEVQAYKELLDATEQNVR
jgi:hypothetical protein